jgi:hydroxyethylthiazole kinase-like uncharacterized protein yjeF
MRPLLTRQGARGMDRDAIERLGLPGIVLMENAGRGAAEAIIARYPKHTRVLCLGGMGQNGGDAWVVARHLANAGFEVRSALVGEPTRITGDAHINFEVLRASGAMLGVIRQPSALDSWLEATDLVVDGVFGTGLTRAVEGLPLACLAKVAAFGLPVVALDLPSGIDADTGAVLGYAKRAALTVTFGAEKRGLLAHPGATYAGEVVVASIGVSAPETPDAYVLERVDLERSVAPRARDAHKGTAGHVAVVGGAVGMTGAVLLAGHAAMRAGAGLVTLCVPEASRPSVEMRVLELMTRAWPSPDEVASLASGKRVLVVGPGMGRDDAARALFAGLVREVALPMVLDADALFHLAALGIETLASAKGRFVLTPHPREAARLLGTTVEAVQADRFAAAQELADRSGHVAVLKGAGTIIAAPGEPLLVCPFGTPALGVAGTGDVLAGALGAFLALPDGATGAVSPMLEKVAAGVVLHALAGERAAVADRGMLASEVADAMPHVIARGT